MFYFSLKTESGENYTTKEDNNFVSEFWLDVTKDFTSEKFETERVSKIQIIPKAIVGSGGKLKFQVSVDGINWQNYLHGSNDVEFDIDSTFDISLLEYMKGANEYCRFVYTKGSISAGLICIKARSYR